MGTWLKSYFLILKLSQGVVCTGRILNNIFRIFFVSGIAKNLLILFLFKSVIMDWSIEINFWPRTNFLKPLYCSSLWFLIRKPQIWAISFACMKWNLESSFKNLANQSHFPIYFNPLVKKITGYLIFFPRFPPKTKVGKTANFFSAYELSFSLWKHSYFVWMYSVP